VRAPGVPGTTVFSKGSVNDEGALPLPVDIRLDRDVAIPKTDGTTLYGDIYRPTTDERVPAILVWTPYTKNGGWANNNLQAFKFGTPRDHLSGLQAFEAPDPGYWACGAAEARTTAGPSATMSSHCCGKRASWATTPYSPTPCSPSSTWSPWTTCATRSRSPPRV
jgi:hypothetical protein